MCCGVIMRMSNSGYVVMKDNGWSMCIYSDSDRVKDLTES